MPEPRLVPYYDYPGGQQLGMVMVGGPPEIAALYANGAPLPPEPPPPVITMLWVAHCPHPVCDWESDGELTEAEARASYLYHLKWIVHDNEDAQPGPGS